MATVTLLLPIVPGRLEAWHRMLQDIQEVYIDSYRMWRAHVGFTNERVWLVTSAPGGVAAHVMCESDLHPAEVWQRAIDPSPFQRWLSSRVREVHAIDLAQLCREHQPELVFKG